MVKAAAPGPGLIDRRVEITGPVDRKMVINALNSGAATYMADFEGILLLLVSLMNQLNRIKLKKTRMLPRGTTICLGNATCETPSDALLPLPLQMESITS
jgi:hypothetical protein